MVVLTDGAHDDPNSLTLEQLQQEIRATRPRRSPLPCSASKWARTSIRSELRAISETTGGESFTTPDPTKISQVSYAALSKIL